MSKQADGKDLALQALLVLESFDQRLTILGESLGLANFAGHKFIDYSLDCLSYTEAKEVFILTSGDVDSVQNYLRQIKPHYNFSFQIHVVKCSKCHSLGDVMRDVDKKGLIKTDFILMHCGTICNDNLKVAVLEHRARRAKDKNCVLTLVYTKFSSNGHARSSDADFLLAVHSANKRLLYHRHIAEKEIDAKIPLDIFMLNDNVDVHFDLLDCNVAICSPQIPPLFSDNFDFESRRDLLREILTNDEILGYSAHVHLLEASMATIVRDYPSYLFSSLRVLERYSSPILPDVLISGDVTSTCTWFKRNLYLHKASLQLAKTAKLIKNVLIGQRCKIGENVTIENSIIGDDCVIGDGTSLKNCILWNKIRIGSKCTLGDALFCSNVQIGNSCTVESRCILLGDVLLNSGSKLENGCTISTKNIWTNEDIVVTDLPKNLSSKKLFKLDLKPQNSSFWPESGNFSLLDQAVLPLDVSIDGSEGEFADKRGSCPTSATKRQVPVDLGVGKTLAATSTQNPMNRLSEDDTNRTPSSDEDTEDENEESFYNLVYEILHRGLEEKIDCSNLILEINCAKPTYNVSVEKFNSMLIGAIVDLSKLSDSAASIAPILKHFLPVLRNYLKNPDSQRHCLTVFENYCHKYAKFAQQLPSVLHYLYDNDVLDENLILKWTADLDETTRKNVQPFLEWLEQADEESSEIDD